MFNPFFSIVIPLYNKENTISKTLYSVLSQTFTNFEILIINDGSTDNSLSLVKSFDDSRIKIFNKKNGGVSSARNFGIANSFANWIAFLDSDDYWEPDYLIKFHNTIINNPTAGLFFCFFTINSKQPYFNKLLTPFIVKNYYKQIKKIKGGISSSSVVINKQIFNEVGLFNEILKVGEDLDMWYRIAWQKDIVFLPYTLAHITAGDSNWESYSYKASYWLYSFVLLKESGLISNQKQSEYCVMYYRELLKYFINGSQLNYFFLNKHRVIKEILKSDFCLLEFIYYEYKLIIKIIYNKLLRSINF